MVSKEYGTVVAAREVNGREFVLVRLFDDDLADEFSQPVPVSPWHSGCQLVGARVKIWKADEFHQWFRYKVVTKL